jgi:hypothetical protein
MRNFVTDLLVHVPQKEKNGRKCVAEKVACSSGPCLNIGVQK